MGRVLALVLCLGLSGATAGGSTTIIWMNCPQNGATNYGLCQGFVSAVLDAEYARVIEGKKRRICLPKKLAFGNGAGDYNANAVTPVFVNHVKVLKQQSLERQMRMRSKPAFTLVDEELRKLFPCD